MDETERIAVVLDVNNICVPGSESIFGTVNSIEAYLEHMGCIVRRLAYSDYCLPCIEMELRSFGYDIPGKDVYADKFIKNGIREMISGEREFEVLALCSGDHAFKEVLDESSGMGIKNLVFSWNRCISQDLKKSYDVVLIDELGHVPVRKEYLSKSCIFNPVLDEEDAEKFRSS